MNKRVKATVVSAVLLASLMGAASVGAEAIPEEWKSLDVAGLTAEAVKLQKKLPSAERDIDLLAQHVAKRYASASAAGTLDIKQWLTLASILSKRLPIETREAMAKEIQTKLVPNQEAIVKLSYQDCTAIAGALSGLGSKQGPVVLATWVEKSDAWQSLEPKDLVRLARDLYRAGDVGKKARARLASHVEAKYLADAKTAQSVSCLDWRGLARHLAADLSAERRGQWISKLRSAFLVTEMKEGDLEALAGALRCLGDKDVGGFAAAWMAKQEIWKSWKAAELARLAANLAGRSEAATSGRRKLASHVEAKYLADAKAAQSVSCLDWRGLARHLAAEFSAERRGQWISKLRSAFLVMEMKEGNLDALVGALRCLGDKDVGGFVAAWMAKHETWKSWKPAELARLAANLGGESEAATSGRLKLASHVEAKYLADAKAVQSVSCQSWRYFTGRLRLAVAFPAERRSKWISRLRTAFLGRKMRGLDLRDLATALRHLGDKDAGGFAAAWMAKHEIWKTWEPAELAKLAANLAGKSEAAASGRLKLASHVEAKYLADAKTAQSVSCRVWRDLAGHLAADLSAEQRSKWTDMLGRAFVAEPVKPDDLWAIVEAIRLLGDESIVQKWTLKVYEHFLGTEKARSAVSLETLCRISGALHNAGLTGRGKRHPELAAAIVSLAKADKLTMLRERGWEGYRSLGRPLGTKADRRVLIDALTDDQGRPRQELLKVLPWTYQFAQEGESWQGLVDKILSKPGLDADGRARWMAAIARTEGPFSHTPLPDTRWLARALAAAESPELQMALLDELVRVHTGTKRYGVALQLIDGAAVRLKRTGAAAKCAALREEVARVRSAYLAKRGDDKAAFKQRIAEARLRELKRRLAGAKRRKDKKKIARLERLIKQHEAATGEEGRSPGDESKSGAR